MRVLKHIAIVLALLVLLLLIFYGYLRTDSGRAWASDKISTQLTDALGTPVEFQDLAVSPFTWVELEEVLVSDHHGDTLLYSNRMTADIGLFSLWDRVILLDRLRLEDGLMSITTHHGDDSNNIKVLVDRMQEGPKSDSPWEFSIEAVDLISFRVDVIDENRAGASQSRFDPSGIRCRDVLLEASEIDMSDGGVSARIDRLSALEQSGLRLDSVQMRLSVQDTLLRMESLVLQTANSRLDADLGFRTTTLADFKSFPTEVLLDWDIHTSDISPKDLAHFAPIFDSVPYGLFARGQVMGTFDEMYVRALELQFGGRSRFFGDAFLENVHEPDDLFLDVEILDLTTHVDDMLRWPLPGMDRLTSKLPSFMERTGALQFRGSVKGKPESLKADGELSSGVGDLEVALLFSSSDGDSGNIQGELRADSLKLGELLDRKDLRTISADIELLYKPGTRPSAELKGDITQLTYKGYDYEDILVDGRLEEGLFLGYLDVNQAEISFEFQGAVDFRQDIPRFDFEMDLFHLDPKELGLLSANDSTTLNGRISAHFEGVEADDFQGNLSLEGVEVCKGERSYFTESIELNSAVEEGIRTLTLRSNPIDLDLVGDYVFKDLPDEILGLLDDVLPSYLSEAGRSPTGRSSFRIDARLKEFSPLLSFLVPGLSISDGVDIHGVLDAPKARAELRMDLDTLTFGGVQLRGMSLDTERTEDVAFFLLENEQIQWTDSVLLVDNAMSLSAYRDTLETDITWQVEDKPFSGAIALVTEFLSPDSIMNRFDPTHIIISESFWDLSENASIDFIDGKFHVGPTTLSSGQERVMLEGLIGDDATDEFFFDLDRIGLDKFNKFIPDAVFSLGGTMDLSGTVRSLTSDPVLVADLFIDELRLGSEVLGDVDLHSTWEKENAAYLFIDGALEKDDKRNLSINGRYYPSLEKGRLEATLSMDEFDLALLNKLKIGAISDIRGLASGALDVRGSVLEPLIEGRLYFSDANVHIDLLNVDFSFNNEVIIEPDWIGFDYIPIKDRDGNDGYVTGTVIHENFRNWNYDFFAEFDEMLVLDTDEDTDQRFFGSVYGTGSVAISGFDRNVRVEIYGTTGPNSELSIPLGSRSDIVFEDFIYFTSEETVEVGEEQKSPLSVELFMEARVTTDAVVNLIFDEKIGDVMSGRAEGLLTMRLDPGSDLEMYGNMSIRQGTYLFTLQNVINKRFDIAPGGTISFFGDPYQAELGLTAIYRSRAALGDLFIEESTVYDQRIPVEVNMDITGVLLQPDIQFYLAFPTLDQSTEAIVQARVDTDQELNRQVFALLVLNKFMPPQAVGVGQGLASGATNTGSEFLSAQLSNWLSQISDDVDIGVNYRAGDQVNSEEFAVALTTMLFQDRLLLTGNFGVQNTSNPAVEQASSLIGDFRLEYMITEDGKLRLKVFNETNQFDILNLDQAPTKQGVGLIFQKDFDGLFDDRAQDVP